MYLYMVYIGLYTHFVCRPIVVLFAYKLVVFVYRLFFAVEY